MGNGSGSGGGLVETERDRLIRSGMLTPFDRLDGFERKVTTTATAAAGVAGAGAKPSGAAVGPNARGV